MSHFFVITLITVQHHSINPHLSPRTFSPGAWQFSVLIREEEDSHQQHQQQQAEIFAMQSENCRITKKVAAARLLRRSLYRYYAWSPAQNTHEWGHGDRGKVTSDLGSHNHNNDHLPHMSPTIPRPWPNINHPSPKINFKINDTKASAVKSIKQTQRQKSSPLICCVCSLVIWIFDAENEKFNVNWTK